VQYGFSGAIASSDALCVTVSGKQVQLTQKPHGGSNTSAHPAACLEQQPCIDTAAHATNYEASKHSSYWPKAEAALGSADTSS
jgi:hypothetical protein